MNTTALGRRERGREVPAAVSYAVGHRIRVELLSALHDLGSASAIELARIVHHPLSTVTHHISELLKSGSILVERTEKVRSVDQRFYCAINPMLVTDEEWETMAEEERQAVVGVTLQALVAESLSSLWSGSLTGDRRLFLCWNWFNVDEQGRADIAEEQLRSWRRIREIEREAEARCAESGRERSSVLVSSTSCMRARTAERPPDAPDAP
jgi:DNA-binding transcriptional ArsR family regulator